MFGIWLSLCKDDSQHVSDMLKQHLDINTCCWNMIMYMFHNKYFGCYIHDIGLSAKYDIGLSAKYYMET